MNSNIKVIFIVLFFSVVVLVGGVLLFSNTTKAKPIDMNLVLGDARWQKGNSEAEVTVVEFSDFQCPACRSAASEVGRVLDRYGDRVRFVYRHFPLSEIHASALDAAVASEIAGSEGKFWEMHDILFERQGEWSETRDARKLFIAFAEELSLDSDSFESSFESGSFEEVILADRSDGRALGVSSTPTFFVGDKVVHADRLYNLVAETIDEQ